MGLAQLALLLRKYYVYFKIIVELSFVYGNISNGGRMNARQSQASTG